MADSLNYNKLKQCRHGNILYNINDQYIGRSFDIYGEYSEAEIALFDQIIQEGQVVIDVGANIGAYTLFFAQKVGLKGSVHAFEPQRLVYQTLCANMAINSITNAFCHNAALGSTRGVITVPEIAPWNIYNFGGMALGTHQEGTCVPLFQLEDLNLTTCHFIKIDVEGMELDVLKGGKNLLQTCRPVLYVENDREEKSRDLINYIDTLGYNMYWHYPPLFNSDNFFNNPENIFGAIISKNMLCIPKSLNYHLDGFIKINPLD